MVRGGGWIGSAGMLRSGARNDYKADTSASFRVVRTLNVQP